jgi:NDP-4-keto-2,6-dideoxyhexose 3-C-methyltransferase
MNITTCRSCASDALRPVLSLGEQHLSEFRMDDSRPPKYPLNLMACGVCTLAQLGFTAPAREMFHGTYSFKSGISEAIRTDLGDVVAYGYYNQPAAQSWLDIACNDGTLLACVPKHIRRVGIDPLAQFADEALAHADKVVTDFFHAEHFIGESFDVITSVSMFYDLDDPNAFVQGVKQVMAPGGIWVIQQNYLPLMLENSSVDNISHEHLAYYSMTSLKPLLESHGLEIVDVELNPINGGCFRTLVARQGEREVTEWVGQLLEEESVMGIGVGGNFSALDAFVKRAESALANLRQMVDTITEAGYSIYVYGASTRGAVIWQAAGLDVGQLPKVVERNPAKVGRYMSAIGAPIISEEQARTEKPDYLLLGPWWLRNNVIERERDYLQAGGHFIVPLPELEVIGG